VQFGVHSAFRRHLPDLFQTGNAFVANTCRLHPAKQDLLDVIDARTRIASILLAGQLLFKEWHAYIDNPMVADAILDRVANTSHRIQLGGESHASTDVNPPRLIRPHHILASASNC
jgi:hypothetical protein